jgi:hypothetical protein
VTYDARSRRMEGQLVLRTVGDEAGLESRGV